MKQVKLLENISKESDVQKRNKLIRKLVSEYLEPSGRFTEIMLWNKVLGEPADISIPKFDGLKRINEKKIKFVPNRLYFSAENFDSKSKSANQEFYDFMIDLMCCYYNLEIDVNDVADVAYRVTKAVSGNTILKDNGIPEELWAQATSDALLTAIPSGAARKYKDDYDKWLQSVVENTKKIEEHTAQIVAESRAQSLQPMPSHVEQALAPFGQGYENRPYVASLEARDSASYSGKIKGLIVFNLNSVIVLETGRETGMSYPISMVSEIQIGSDLHTEYAGFGSTTTQFWTITIITTDFQQIKRWIYLGKNEAEMNINRPAVMKELNFVSQVFEIVEGDDWQTQSGTQLSYGVGFGVIE